MAAVMLKVEAAVTLLGPQVYVVGIKCFHFMLYIMAMSIIMKSLCSNSSYTISEVMWGTLLIVVPAPGAVAAPR